MSQPLRPWDGSEEAPEEAPPGYLYGAAMACGLILALGGRALLGHYKDRPYLAEADPWLYGLAQTLPWLGWVLVVLAVGLWVRSLRKV